MKTPEIPIAFITKDRTRVACYTLDSVLKNIVTSQKIRLIISDDQSESENHIKYLSNVSKINEIDPIVVKTTKDCHGLGASMNNALHEAWKYSDKCLTIEDDWYLQKKLYLDNCINTMDTDDTIVGIRLGIIESLNHVLPYNRYFYKIVSQPGLDYTFIYNFQIMLRSKRIYDKLGYYTHNSPDEDEKSFALKQCALSDRGRNENIKTLYPTSMPRNTIDDPGLYFIHMGKSIVNHTVYIPERFNWIYEEMTEKSPDYNLYKTIVDM